MDLDKKYLNKIQNISFQPVFILGLSRSGTSILHKILARTQCFNYVDVYHIINYDNLLYNHIFNKEEIVKNELNKTFEEHNIMDRGIDAFKVTADSPEEYGFILYNKTSRISINSRNISSFFELSKKIQFISKNNKPLLLKNPWDFSNFMYLKKVIPNPKFIFIHRHPFKSFSSAMKTQRFLFKEKPFYHSLIDKFYEQMYQYPLLVRLNRPFYTKLSPLGLIYITSFSARYVKYFLKNFNKLSSAEFINVKYEDLCENTSKTMKTILDFLDVKPEEQINYNNFIKTRDYPLDPVVVKMKKFIYNAMKSYFDYFGYECY